MAEEENSIYKDAEILSEKILKEHPEHALKIIDGMIEKATREICVYRQAEIEIRNKL